MSKNHPPERGAYKFALAMTLACGISLLGPLQFAEAQVFSDQGDVRYSQTYQGQDQGQEQEPVELEAQQNYTRKKKSKDKTDYERQEEAIQNSKALYGDPSKMARAQAQPLEPAYQAQDPYYNQTYSGYAAKPSRLKNALGTAGRILGTTAAVAVPVTSIVLMSRMAARNNMTGGMSGNMTGGRLLGGGFNRISGF